MKRYTVTITFDTDAWRGAVDGVIGAMLAQLETLEDEHRANVGNVESETMECVPIAPSEPSSFDDTATFERVALRLPSVIPGAWIERCMSSAWMLHGLVERHAGFTVLATPHWDSRDDVWIVLDREGVQETIASVPFLASGDTELDVATYLGILRSHVPALRAAAETWEARR